jgi:hypothetical protein
VFGVDAIVTEVDGRVSYTMRDKQGVVEKNIDIDAIDTDARLHIRSDDYLFNGIEGFSVMYPDEGQGTYDVCRVFKACTTRTMSHVSARQDLNSIKSPRTSAERVCQA